MRVCFIKYWGLTLDNSIRLSEFANRLSGFSNRLNRDGLKSYKVLVRERLTVWKKSIRLSVDGLNDQLRTDVLVGASSPLIVIGESYPSRLFFL